MDIDADDQAMAQALGFSSFGAQDRPQKKRKYNPHADAAGLVSQGSHSQASTGSNSTPIGSSRRVEALQSASNADEIALDDDEGADENESVQAENLHITSDAQEGASTSGAPAHLLGLPQRPPPSATTTHPSSRAEGHQEENAHRRPWFEGYYDPSSNENPWKRLETSLGLQSKGSWISRDVGAATTR